MEADAQTVGVNERGDSIIVFDDGSWRYFDAKLDKELLEKDSKTEVTLENVPEFPTKSKKKKVKPVKSKKQTSSKGAKIAKVKKPKKNKKSKKQKIAKQSKSSKAKKGKSKKGKVAKQYKAPNKKSSKKGSAADLANESKLREEAINRAELTATEASIKLQDLEDAGYELLLLEEELKSAYTSTTTTDESIVRLEQRIQLARKKEAEHRESYETSRKLADFYNRLIDLPEEKRQKLLAKEYAKSGKLNEVTATAIETIDPEMVPTLQEGVGNVPNQKLKAEKQLKRTADLIRNPPLRPCPDVQVGFNEFTGKRRLTMDEAPFFSNTPEQMRLVLRDREYLEAFGKLEKVGNLTFLKLRIVIASSNAQNSYGLIEKGSRLTIKFIDGSNLPIFANGTVQGNLNNLEKTVTYEVAYYLDKAALKVLRKAEIDKIRLVWLTGFEDYEIYDLDFLAQRVQCLDQ